jgi:hypothetical protein
MNTRDRVRAALDRIYGERYVRPGLEDRVLSAARERGDGVGRRLSRALLIATAVAVVLAVLAVATLLSLGRLTRPSLSPAGQPSPATSASPSSGAPSPTQAPGGPSGSAATAAPGTAPGNGAPPRCHTGDVSATLTQGSPGAGQRYATLTLANRSGHACQVYGYVGMLLLDASGQPLPTSVVRTPPSPSRVVVQPGGQVSAQMHWTVVPGPDESQAGACEPAPASAMVTPPDETTQLAVPWTMGAVCLHGRIEVTPLAAR